MISYRNGSAGVELYLPSELLMTLGLALCRIDPEAKCRIVMRLLLLAKSQELKASSLRVI